MFEIKSYNIKNFECDQANTAYDINSNIFYFKKFC